MENSGSRVHRAEADVSGGGWTSWLLAFVVAAAIFLECIIPTPSLMDDADAVQAQITRNMVASDDWGTARLDGIIYLEKPPLIYWIVAASYKIFDVHDWSARLPVALSSIALALLTAVFGTWASGKKAGTYAGATLATFTLLFLVRHTPAPGDIANALSTHPSAYSLSLGHMLDPTLDSFAISVFRSSWPGLPSPSVPWGVFSGRTAMDSLRQP